MENKDKNKCTIIPITYAKSSISENLVVKGGDKSKKISISFTIYLILYKNKKILVDVGCEELDGFILKDLVSPTQKLRQFGFCSEQITDVIITHSHHDHVSLVNAYENATVYVQKDEKVLAEKYLSKAQKIKTFIKKYKVCSLITIKKIGGHTKGSSIVIIKNEGKKNIICGDEFYTELCIKEKKPSGNCFSEKRNKRFLNYCIRSNCKILYSHN